ncbi:MAG: ABC transporter substrate-binding protein [Caldilineaceae bacterium]
MVHIYNSSIETSVSSGPFMLEEFDPATRSCLEPNPTYNGFRPPRLQRIECISMDPSTMFAAFQNNEIDTVNYGFLTPPTSS